MKIVWLAGAYAKAGRAEEARAILAEPEIQRAGPEQSTGLAIAYFALGERDKGFDALRKAFDSGGLVIFTNADPQFDSVRSDPRFRALVARMGIPDAK